MVENIKTYPNETMRLLLERASCRNFSGRKVPENVLRTILEAGVHAPSGGNLQPFSIIKIKRKKSKILLAEMCGQPFIAEAPVNLLFSIDWHLIKRWAQLEKAPFTANDSFRHFWISFQDTIISAQNVCTAADALGLGSVYVGTVMDFILELQELFNMPQYVCPVVLLCLGYPTHYPKPRKKLPVNFIVHDEQYNDPSDQEVIEAFNNKYPHVKISITRQRLEQIEWVCRKVHSDEFTQKCLSKIRQQGYISAAQKYFALHYRADVVPGNNEEFLENFKKLGFKWFEKFIFNELNIDEENECLKSF